MKALLNATLSWMALLLLFSSSSLQATAIDDLNEVIFYANQAKTNAKNARSAARSLAIQYFQLNNTNIGGYIIQIQNEMSELEEASDEINFYIQSAANKNPNIDPDDILAWSSELEALEDFVNQKALSLQQLIASNQRLEARVVYRELRAHLKEQITLCNQIRLEAIALQAVAQTYNVRIELLYDGQVYTGSTTLGGFYAFNQDLGQYFYPGFNDDNQFLNLPGGTYTFGSYDGYFDGTNTVTLSLDPSMIGSDGFVVVQLNYWSE